MHVFDIEDLHTMGQVLHEVVQVCCTHLPVPIIDNMAWARLSYSDMNLALLKILLPKDLGLGQ